MSESAAAISEFQKFDTFDPRILHRAFPEMDLFQLSPGTFRGWIFFSQGQHCRITAGNFNQSTLCEGHYNRDSIHLGFILSLGHTAVVQARRYDNGTLTLHQNSIAMHEVFPPDLTWVDIAIPKQAASQVMPPEIMKEIAGHSQLFLQGDRETLAPLIQWISDTLAFPEQRPTESQLLDSINQVLRKRLDALTCQPSEPAFTEGDQFRMHIIHVIHKLKKESITVCSLSEICAAANMKPRTVQKYFHEIYGLGPTEYFRIRRLNLAHADLLTGANKVIEVAQQRKFPHLGRFAGRYKKHFGESPSSTLKRATHK